MLSLSNGLEKLTKNTAVKVNAIVGGPTFSEGVAETIEPLAKEQNQEVIYLKRDLMQQIKPTSLLQRFIDPS